VPEHLRLAPNEPLTVWCAACSNGVEAYSYAMYIHRLLTRIKADLSFKVFGTDINQQLIETAKKGEYEISKGDLRDYSAYFKRYGELDGDKIRFGDEIRRHLSFRTFDIRSRPRKHRFNVIICANVFQYYKDEAREHFLKNFVDVSKLPGYIFVGPMSPEAIDRFGLTNLLKYKMLRM
jgi:chemotaxis methyl-accepting protein methylase